MAKSKTSPAVSIVKKKEDSAESPTSLESSPLETSVSSEVMNILPLNQIVGLPGDELGFTLQSPDLIELVLKHRDANKALMTLCRHQFKTEQDVSFFGVKASVVDTEVLPKKRLRFRLKFHERAEVIWVEKESDYNEKIKGSSSSQQSSESDRSDAINLGKEKSELLLCRHRIVKRRSLTELECKAAQREVIDGIKAAMPFAKLDNIVFANDLSNFDEATAKCATAMDFPLEDRLALLEDWSMRRRVKTFLELFHKNLKVLQLRKQLRQRTQDRLQKMERDVMLQEERKVIDQELKKGQKSCPPEFVGLKESIASFQGPEEVKTTLDRDFDRLLRSGSGSPQAATIQDYLETLLDVPWSLSVEPRDDWTAIEATLQDSHYGLETVKKRLLRYLAVVALSGSQPGAILCLVGPPGVGKTSFAKAIAEALGLPFVKKSMGGVRDESEVRGHRRTYIGAMPGRIVQGLKKVKCNNPVFLLDEVDKLGNDHRGDPSSALLEVLDAEENHRFSDHYLELDLDLSKVFWVLTANHEDQIPSALKDRLEMIHFSSYTETEKLHIGRDYLCRRNMEKQGLADGTLRLSDAVLKKLIREYSREAGVRQLDRNIATIVQFLALEKVRDQKRGSWSLGVKRIPEALGPGQHLKPSWNKATWTAGVIAGLAWTASGGTVMRLECASLPGKGELKLTGKLGDVMKESAHTAFSFLKSEHTKCGLEASAFLERDFHIHIPAGAVPKEGPSAGMGLAMLMYSAASGLACQPFCAMTGEITLHGRVLAIGGVKEKLLAAYQEGIRHVLLPEANRSDVEHLEIEELESMTCIYVESFWEAFKALFPAKKGA